MSMDNINITEAQYVALDGENIGIRAVIDGQTMGIPLDVDNIHYAAILDWVAEGNTIADAD